MSKAGLDNRKQDGEIGHKHGATPIGTLRKIYGQGFAAGYPPTDTLSDVLPSPERDVAEPASPRLQDRSSRSQDHERLALKTAVISRG